ncbi:MAG TPA: hypothetical protein VKD91_13585 [Pyrinomonadaceae bacterium]|nr:hypothetical protein [Pyrinomonadaceae bacterium]
MFGKSLLLISILLTAVAGFGQKKSYDSPGKTVRALIVPVGAKGCETFESRVDIRSSSGALLRRKSFWSRDHNHGEGVGHAEWTSDGRFFVFNTNSSGGHQPWHSFTYMYSARANKFYNLDSSVGAITSDFKLQGEVLVTTRLASAGGKDVPLTVRLSRWR